MAIRCGVVVQCLRAPSGPYKPKKNFVQTNKRGVIVLTLYWKTKWFRFCHGGACFAQPEKPTFRAGEPVWERASIMVFVHLFTTDWTLS